jgi:Asp-tRNA(Asn)/Glu-tRNA(Gln) amidotransferase C subunit
VQESKEEITREKLHHLLRLSALPPPKNKVEEDSMLNTLAAQIHFVKEIQKVDTTGVEPLVAIRDETDEAVREQMVTAHKLEQFFAQEEKVGPNGTIRRRKDGEMVITDDRDSSPTHYEPADRLEAPFELGRNETNRRIGNFFYVKRAKKDAQEG